MTYSRGGRGGEAGDVQRATNRKQADTPARDIVVWVDDGAASRAALRWAAGEAGRRGGQVRAVVAWQSDAVGAARRLEDAVGGAAAGSTAWYPSMELVRGDPAEVLARVSHGARLLVVGRRGGSGGPVVGVPTARLPGAACPVVEVAEPIVDAWSQPSASASETVG